MMRRSEREFKADEGDIIEIETPEGLAYAQFTHRHERYGELIRVFSGYYGQRPEDFNEIVHNDEQFMAFVLLDLAVREGLLSIVGHTEIPEDKRRFPVFRSNPGKRANEVTKNWWLWDGERSWYVGELTEGQHRYPIRGISNPAAIIDKLRMGWRAERFC